MERRIVFQPELPEASSESTNAHSPIINRAASHQVEELSIHLAVHTHVISPWMNHWLNHTLC